MCEYNVRMCVFVCFQTKRSEPKGDVTVTRFEVIMPATVKCETGALAENAINFLTENFHFNFITFFHTPTATPYRSRKYHRNCYLVDK